MAGINIPFLSNVRDFLRGTGDVESALDDVAGSLDDMADDAQDASTASARSLEDVSDALGGVSDAGRDMSRSLDDGADAGTDAAQRLERSFRDSLDAVRTESASAGDAVGRNMDDGARQAGEGLSTIQDEASGTATEVAASFDGSAESIAGGFQELAANAFAGFGPAGAVAGLAAAAGIGLVMSSMEEAKEEAQATAEQVAEIAGEMIDLGSSKRGPEQIRDALAAAAAEAEDGEIKLRDWADAADKAGIDYSDYAAGLAGDSEAAARALNEVAQKISQEEAAIKGREEAMAGGGSATYLATIADQVAAHNTNVEALKEVRTALNDASGIVDESSEVFDLYTAAVDASAAANLAADEAASAAAESIRDSASAALEASNAEIGYAASLQDTSATIAENGATLDLATEQGRANKSALNDLAAQTLAVADATLQNGQVTETTNAKLAEGRDAFIANALAAGMTEQAAIDLATSYGLVPRTVSTAVSSSGVDAVIVDMNRIPKSMTLSVSPSIDLASWQRAVDSTAAGLRAPVIPFKSAHGGPTF